MRLAVLQFETLPDYAANLARLIDLVNASEVDLALAPEVCLTGFDYANFEAAAAFAAQSEAALLELSQTQAIALTRIEKEGDRFYNVFRFYDKGRCLYAQKKNRLFLLGDEHRYFAAGDAEAIKPFEWNGWKIGVLICFELRFTKLWQQLDGCELLLLPAMWGLPRKRHYEALSEALAITNRCFVAASDSANGDMAKGSAIITPWGEVSRNDRADRIMATLDKREITKAKRAVPYDA